MNVSDRAVFQIYQVIKTEIDRQPQHYLEKSLPWIAATARYNERTTSTSLRILEQTGQLIIERPRPGAPRRYRLPT